MIVLSEGSYHHTPVDKSQDASYNLQKNKDDKTNDELHVCVWCWGGDENGEQTFKLQT